MSSTGRQRSHSVASTCTLQEEDDRISDVFDGPIIDLTNDDAVRGICSLLRDGEFFLDKFRASGFVVGLGDFIEVDDIELGGFHVRFLQVRAIVETREGRTKLRGIPFVSNSELDGRLPRKRNEVCMILRFDADQSEYDGNPLMVDASSESFRWKRPLQISNAIWPEHQSSPQGSEQHSSLVCRWKLKLYVAGRGRATKVTEEAIERIQFGEVLESRYRVNDEVLRNRWRGGYIRGGSWYPTSTSQIDVDGKAHSAKLQSVRGANQKYTLFDSFSGAGGVSRGAQCAGFQVRYAVDKASEVWETYRENFPTVKLYKMSIDKFIVAAKDENIRTDILHLSPPCQYFSPAHTQQSAHDDENIFALFGCHTLVDKIRPRLITVEQTFGIAHERHTIYLRKLIGDFTQQGYSVRWKIVRLCTWGSAQDRKRLIMIAAAPGEKLPPLPAATHSQGGEGGLKPFTTLGNAIGAVRIGDDLHDLVTVKHFYPRRARIDPNRLAGTITTGGSEMYYPDGSRDFTLREFASLQGFPKTHRFRGNKTNIKRQIGNAFPPNTVQVLYKHLEQWLLKEDGMLPYSPQFEDIVTIDDDSESSTNPSFSAATSPSMDEFMDIDDAISGGRGPHTKHCPIIDLT